MSSRCLCCQALACPALDRETELMEENIELHAALGQMDIEAGVRGQWSRRWKALAKAQRARHRLSIRLLGIELDGHLEAYAKAKADLADQEVVLKHLRTRVRIAVRKLERDLEFGERSAYVEEALEALR